MPRRVPRYIEEVEDIVNDAGRTLNRSREVHTLFGTKWPDRARRYAIRAKYKFNGKSQALVEFLRG